MFSVSCYDWSDHHTQALSRASLCVSSLCVVVGHRRCRRRCVVSSSSLCAVDVVVVVVVVNVCWRRRCVDCCCCRRRLVCFFCCRRRRYYMLMSSLCCCWRRRVFVVVVDVCRRHHCVLTSTLCCCCCRRRCVLMSSLSSSNFVASVLFDMYSTFCRVWRVSAPWLCHVRVFLWHLAYENSIASVVFYVWEFLSHLMSKNSHWCPLLCLHNFNISTEFQLYTHFSFSS